MAPSADLRTMRTMRHVHFVLLLMVTLVLGSFGVTQSACTQSASPAAAATTSTPSSPIAPVGTVKQIMKGIVDPSSAAIWDAVSTESGPKGDIEKAPKTDEEWAGRLTAADGSQGDRRGEGARQGRRAERRRRDRQRLRELSQGLLVSGREDPDRPGRWGARFEELKFL